ncbi:hypothetical protein HNP40_002954 [Mycobacteroides chelonae]|nr:hypothetical protein [Mycobacteroides chelonae]
MGPGTGAPLLEGRPRTQTTVPVWARNGIFARTAVAGKDVIIHLPDEMRLNPASWGPNGMATYSSNDADYVVTPVGNGGVDVTVRNRNPFSDKESEFFIKLPTGTHLLADGNTTLVKSNDEGPQNPSRPIGAFSAPVARTSSGAPVDVAVGLTPLGEIILTPQAASLGAGDYPLETTFSYRPVD